MRTVKKILVAALAAGATSLVAGAGVADSSPEKVLPGRAKVYEHLDPTSLESTSSPERIKAVAAGNAAPTEIWRVLEHGEKVECLDCIPHVAKLLYDGHHKTREIAAWWLRRRIFGVFTPSPGGGPSLYAQVVATLNDPAQPATRRAFAAEAVGEFLTGAGVRHLARAATADPEAIVRVAAVKGLERLNSQGPNGELAKAVADSDEGVRLQALHSAIRVNVFTGVHAVVARIDDESPLVRRRAAEALGVMKAADAVVGLVALTDPVTEADAQVRKAAVAALGQIADPGGRAAVERAANDPDYLVRDAAKVALRRL